MQLPLVTQWLDLWTTEAAMTVGGGQAGEGHRAGPAGAW